MALERRAARRCAPAAGRTSHRSPGRASMAAGRGEHRRLDGAVRGARRGAGCPEVPEVAMTRAIAGSMVTPSTRRSAVLVDEHRRLRRGDAARARFGPTAATSIGSTAAPTWRARAEHRQPGRARRERRRPRGRRHEACGAGPMRSSRRAYPAARPTPWGYHRARSVRVQREVHDIVEWVATGEWEDIRYETAGGIAKLTINRPEVRNAFRPTTLFELTRALRAGPRRPGDRGDRAHRRGDQGVLLRR